MSVSLIRGRARWLDIAAVLWAGAVVPVAAGAAKSDDLTPAALEQLDGRFQAWSSQFYARLVRVESPPLADSFESLVRNIDEHRRRNQPIRAVAAVIGNRALVERNLDTAPVIGIGRLLFETNEWNTASELYRKVQAQGDRTLVSGISLALAKHHFDRRHWKETIDIVATLRSDLPPEDYHHALLMHGIALQQLRKHRLALGQYARIPPASRYYTAARLNMAVANIRQDWWTDAHTIIDALLADKTRRPGSELTDRLYTVLGYSLLHQQYYRNSREAFRNVTLDGGYANRALLGIALTAAYQDDYLGALNALNILKAKPQRDLPVDEATLLVPYFHEKLGQLTTASVGYGEAVAHYERRLREIAAAAPDNAQAIRAQLLAGDSRTVTLNGEVLDLGEKLPPFFFSNLRMLAQFRPHVAHLGDPGLTRDFEALDAATGQLLLAAARMLLDEKAGHLRHYMSQSRYGLARMQDHDAVAPR